MGGKPVPVIVGVTRQSWLNSHRILSVLFRKNIVSPPIMGLCVLEFDNLMENKWEKEIPGSSRNLHLPHQHLFYSTFTMSDEYPREVI